MGYVSLQDGIFVYGFMVNLQGQLVGKYTSLIESVVC